MLLVLMFSCSCYSARNLSSLIKCLRKCDVAAIISLKVEEGGIWGLEKMTNDTCSPLGYYHGLYTNNSIPYFESMEQHFLTKDIFSSGTISGLADDMIIYIIDSKPGKYWTGLKPNKYMPVGWKNGYSKGICLNAKKVF